MAITVDPVITRHVQREITAARAKQLAARACGDEACEILATGMLNRALERWSQIEHRKTLTPAR